MPSKPSFIDIGVNLTHKQLYDDLQTVVENMVDANIQKAIITSSTIDETNVALEIIKKYPEKFYTTVGYHPHNAKDFLKSDINKMKDLLENSYVVAVGECGLDYYREYSSKEAQISCFEKHLDLASQTEAPLFLHERHAFEDFYEMLKSYSDKLNKYVVHCFTGDKNQLIKYLDLGAFIGLTGWITDHERGSHLHEIVKYIPHDRLLIETDAPYLIPHNIKFKHDGINQPAYLKYVAEAIAKHMGLDIKYLSNITINNTKEFFNIK
tara:strand:+ start:45 stop:842 length:798 start_codon:yes stop_codon:yes gene_type:complete